VSEEVNLLSAEVRVHRPAMQAMLRGWRKRCPNCGGGPLYSGYLKVRPTCASCSQELHHHKADDLPAWATILIVGHVVVGGMVATELSWSPPAWLHWTVWPVVALLMTLSLLPCLKGVVVGLQWAWGMHGFGGRD